MPELGSKISLISKADIRYEGRLFTVDPQECTIALASGKISRIVFILPLSVFTCVSKIVVKSVKRKNSSLLFFCKLFLSVIDLQKFC